MTEILIYHTDPMLAQRLCDCLHKEALNAQLCCDNNPDGELLASSPLILLDAQMKWTVCRPLLEAFSRAGCPILFLTGDKKHCEHLHALYAGPNDVLLMPTTNRILLRSVRKLLHKVAPQTELVMDDALCAAYLHGRRVDLTAQEYALLEALLSTPDRPVSREQLLRQAWGYQSMGETRTVDVHVQRLRRKLGEDIIETVYKCGYRLKLA